MIILSYFDDKAGPTVFCSYPKIMIDVVIRKGMCKFMDFDVNDGYSIFVRNDVRIFNFPFEIVSELSRGKIMSLMLSVIIEKDVSSEIENVIHNLFISFRNDIKRDENIYRAFFRNSFECAEKKELLISFMNILYERMIVEDVL